MTQRFISIQIEDLFEREESKLRLERLEIFLTNIIEVSAGFQINSFVITEQNPMSLGQNVVATAEGPNDVAENISKQRDPESAHKGQRPPTPNKKAKAKEEAI